MMFNRGAISFEGDPLLSVVLRPLRSEREKLPSLPSPGRTKSFGIAKKMVFGNGGCCKQRVLFLRSSKLEDVEEFWKTFFDVFFPGYPTLQIQKIICKGQKATSSAFLEMPQKSLFKGHLSRVFANWRRFAPTPSLPRPGERLEALRALMKVHGLDAYLVTSQDPFAAQGVLCLMVMTARACVWVCVCVRVRVHVCVCVCCK